MRFSKKVAVGLGLIILLVVLLAHHKAPSAEFGSVAVLPDSQLTPGAINPQITQDNIGDNICNPNWSTKSERPPSSYTTQLKIKQLVQYGYADTKTADFEEDHLISLELGGNPTDPKNLWPQSYKPVPGAKEKDSVENYLHKEVCSGAISLKTAQQEISTNWYKVYQSMPRSRTFGSIEDSDDEGFVPDPISVPNTLNGS